MPEEQPLQSDDIPPPSNTTESTETSAPPALDESPTTISTISNGEGEKEIDFENEDDRVEMPPPKPVLTNLTSLSDVGEVENI